MAVPPSRLGSTYALLDDGADVPLDDSGYMRDEDSASYAPADDSQDSDYKESKSKKQAGKKADGSVNRTSKAKPTPKHKSASSSTGTKRKQDNRDDRNHQNPRPSDGASGSRHLSRSAKQEDMVDEEESSESDSDSDSEVNSYAYGPRKRTRNKNGDLRKEREPRPKLQKWTDGDWKQACLGIVWACGEAQIQIPFEKAAPVINEHCTASALQQALLKLRGKQIAEGRHCPPMKMAWTKKGQTPRAGSSTPAAAGQDVPVTPAVRVIYRNAPRKPTKDHGVQVRMFTARVGFHPKDDAAEDEDHDSKGGDHHSPSNSTSSSSTSSDDNEDIEEVPRPVNLYPQVSGSRVGYSPYANNGHGLLQSQQMLGSGLQNSFSFSNNASMSGSLGLGDFSSFNIQPQAPSTLGQAFGAFDNHHGQVNDFAGSTSLNQSPAVGPSIALGSNLGHELDPSSASPYTSGWNGLASSFTSYVNTNANVPLTPTFVNSFGRQTGFQSTNGDPNALATGAFARSQFPSPNEYDFTTPPSPSRYGTSSDGSNDNVAKRMARVRRARAEGRDVSFLQWRGRAEAELMDIRRTSSINVFSDPAGAAPSQQVALPYSSDEDTENTGNVPTQVDVPTQVEADEINEVPDFNAFHDLEIFSGFGDLPLQVDQV